MGVGTDPENLQKWVDLIWNKYATGDKETCMLKRSEFMKFIKASFKSSTFNYKFKDKEFQEMLDLRIKMYSGLITRDNMMKFLKELNTCKPCDIRPEVNTTDGVEDPDKEKGNF